MAETETATTQSEVTAKDEGSGLAQRAFKFGFVACIALAMTGWLAFLGWLVWSLLGF